MSNYVTHEEMREFVANELAKAATGLVKVIETRATTTALALRLAVTAETLAFVSLLCQKDRGQIISRLESMMEAQEVGFLYTTMTEEQIVAHHERLAAWIHTLRKLPS